MVIWSKWKNNRPDSLHIAKFNRDTQNKFFVLFNYISFHACFNFNFIWMSMQLTDALKDRQRTGVFIRMCSGS